MMPNLDILKDKKKKSDFISKFSDVSTLSSVVNPALLWYSRPRQIAHNYMHAQFLTQDQFLCELSQPQ